MVVRHNGLPSSCELLGEFTESNRYF